MYLAIAAVFREESRYIREWVAWHRVHGAGHFFLVDNNDDPAESDRTRAALADYLAAGVVRIEPSPPTRYHFQADAYQLALWELGDRCTWLAGLDVDEYLMPTEGQSVLEVLRDAEALPDLAALYVNWAVFGTSGLSGPPECRVRSFTRRAVRGFDQHRKGKVIVRPWRTWNGGGHQALPVGGSFWCCDGSYRERVGKESVGTVWDRLRLNHYATGSAACWAAKARRGFESPAGAAATDWQRKYHHLTAHANAEIDASAHRFLPQLLEETRRGPHG